MKRLLIILSICLFPLIVLAAVDTFDGVTGIDTWDGMTNVDTIDGQTITSAAAATDYTADANCQAAWLFEDDATDSSGEGNTLTLNGDPAYSATVPAAYSSKSMYFDGTGDYASIADAALSASFCGKNGVTCEDITVVFWLKADTLQANRQVMGKATCWEFDLTWDENLHIEYFDGTDSSNPQLTATIGFDWYHVVVSFDGSATQTTTWISQATFGDVENGTQDTLTNVGFVAGNENFNFEMMAFKGGTEIAPGYLDEVAVFNRTMNAIEAEGIFDCGLEGSGC